MAVVEKKPEVKTASPFDRLAVASLAGVVFLLGSLAVAFKAVPALCNLVGLTSDLAFGPVLSGTLSLVALGALAVLGYRLLGGAESRPGLRAGIFVGLIFLVLWVLFSRWVGGICEGSAYDGWLQGLGNGVGAGIAVGLSLALGFWLTRVFLRPAMEKRLIWFEEAGWFSVKAFKPGQGSRVRRGTILGVLMMAISGIWVMMNHRVLERGSSNWELNIPFTGKVPVDDLGDAARVVTAANGRNVLENKHSLDTLRVLSPGSETNLKANTTVSRKEVETILFPLVETKRKELVAVLADLEKSAKGRADLAARQTDQKVRNLLENERDALQKWIFDLKQFLAILTPRDSGPGIRVFLVQRDLELWLKAERDRESELRRADDARKVGDDLATIAKWVNTEPLPVAGFVLSRAELREVNEELSPLHYRVLEDRDSAEAPFATLTDQHLRFKKNQRIGMGDFEKSIKAIRTEEQDERLRADSEEKARKAAPEAKQMKGSVYYASILLLPAVRYTLPLLLLLLSIWVAWRIVNLPTFADFLIATEAEMNKVSWTTRQRLIQDTKVVLVTMVMMAMFLFVVDVAWAKLLSWKPVGVLRSPTDDDSKPKSKQEKDLKW